MARKCTVDGCRQFVFGTCKKSRKGFCRAHQYLREDFDNRSIAQKALDKIKNEDNSDESLKNLEEYLVAIHSLWIRLREANAYGITSCFVCHKPIHYKEAHNSHYIDRAHRATRYSDENCHVSCPPCNLLHNDNKEPYTQAMEQWKKGITEYLKEISREVYNYTRDDIKQLLSEYQHKLQLVQSKLVSVAK